jgi:hypothetical protein
MILSYFVDPVLEEFLVFCFEDDDCVWEQFFATKEDAEEFGRDYVAGYFADGFPANSVIWKQEREVRIPFDI